MPISLVISAGAALIASSTTVIAALGTVGAAVAGALFATTVGAIFAKRTRQDFTEPGRLETVRQPIAPWQWIYGETRVGGIITFMEAFDVFEANSTMHMVVTIAGHEVDSITGFYLNDEEVTVVGGEVTTGPFAGAIEIFTSRGNEAAGVQPFPVLVSQSAGLWTNANHLQTGKAKLHVVMAWDPDIFANGMPKITVKVKGRRIYDPRDVAQDPDDESTWEWSDNWALCVADYLRSEAGLGCAYSEIDEAQLIAAANICDELVNLAGGGTEKRYTLNGSFLVESTPRETLGRLNTAAHGVCRFIGGKWKIYPAAYVAPTITLTADDLRGALRVTPRVSRRDLCNGVKGLYSSPDNFWQPTDFPPVTNATYLTEDHGERIWRELDLPFTDSAAMAQRIAKIELEQVRQQIVVEWPGKLGCYRLQPGDTVMVTLDRYGWSAKVFEVAAVKLAFEEEGDGVILGCDLVLRETASSVYDWNSGEETEVDPAPDTNLPNPFNVGAPGQPAISETLVETRDGRGVASKATVTWTASADAFVVNYQPEYRAVGAPDWTVLPLQTSTTVEIFDIAPGRYDFRVKALNNIGVSSAYSTTLNHEIQGIAGPPATPTGVSLQVAGGTAIITLSQHPDIDVLRGGRILVRHTEALTLQSWEESTSIGNQESWQGDSVVIFLPLKPGSYLVKARDAIGQESTSFALVVTKQASVLAFAPAAGTLQEDNTFPGTKTDCVVVSNTLRLVETGGVVEPAGTYTFSAGFDFGVVTRVRITGQIEAAVFNANDLIDSRLDNIDSWPDFDGTSGIGSGADCWLEARETDDDPAGTPTWSEWKRLDAAEFECRGMQFRLQMVSEDSTINLQVDVLRVKADEVP